MTHDGDRTTVILTEDLLEELAARWRAQRLPIIEALRPGLGDAQMDELTESLGLTLPREARTWWGWHDGATSDGHGSSNLGPGRLFSPLADAVRATAETRETMRGKNGELDPVWRYSWLRMASGGERTIIECGVGFEEPVPARYYRPEEPETGARGVPSIGTLVSLYIDAFDRGAWAYDADRRVWCGDASKQDPATRNLHLT